MADFAYVPAPDYTTRLEPRAIVARFGDGYEQRAGAGVNPLLRVWELTFSRLTADVDAIDLFLRGKASVTSFTWALPAGGEARVVCRRWTRSDSQETAILTATFEEVLA
jgi:phage-related protein